MKLSIRYKILLGFALVLVLSYSAQTIAFQITDRYIRSQTTAILADKAKSAANEIQGFITQVEVTHLGIARGYMRDQKENSSYSANLIDTAIRQNPLFTKIAILASSGKEIIEADAHGETPDELLSFEIQTEPFNEALAGKTSMSKVYYAEEGTPHVDMYTPIVDGNGKIAGVVKSQIKLSELWNIISQEGIGKSGFAYVVDEEGRLLAHPDNNLAISGPNFSSRKIVSDLLGDTYDSEKVAPYFYENEQGVNVIAVGQHINSLNWSVIVEQSTNEAFMQRNLLRGLFVGTLIVSLLLLIGVSFLLSEGVTNPIRQLQAATALIQQGKLDTQVDIESGDEIEALGHSVDTMADRLRDTIAQLKDKITQLENQKSRLNQSAKLLLRRDLLLRSTNEELEQEKERVEAERNKLQVVLSGITDGVVAVDLDRKILIFNAAAEELLGYKAVEVIGKSIDQFMAVYENNVQLTVDTYCPVVSTSFEGVVFSKQSLKIIAAKGKTIMADLVAQQIWEGSAVNLGCILAIHDITHEHELEKMKLDFVSMAAHELRTPLTTVQGYLSFLQEAKTQEKLAEDEKEFINRASLSAIRLNKLIENLLVVSRIEQGKMIVKPEPIQLEPIVEKLITEFTGTAKSKNLELLFLKPPRLLSKVMADATRIEEVVSNLVGNALNYTQKGGITVTLVQRDKEIVFSVKDTGQGIPAEALEHLFTKFFRIKGDLEAGSKGTGLGLYISKNIVEAHGGKIWVESQVNIGSTFYFSLPVSPAA